MKNSKTLSIVMMGIFCLSYSVIFAQSKNKRPTKPNIIMLISDDTGWGDLGVYGGGVGRGMPTPNLDKMAKEGMQFWDFYGQPSCTPLVGLPCKLVEFPTAPV